MVLYGCPACGGEDLEVSYFQAGEIHINGDGAVTHEEADVKEWGPESSTSCLECGEQDDLSHFATCKA